LKDRGNISLVQSRSSSPKLEETKSRQRSDNTKKGVVFEPIFEKKNKLKEREAKPSWSSIKESRKIKRKQSNPSCLF